MITFPRYFNPACIVQLFTLEKVPLAQITVTGSPLVSAEHRVRFVVVRTLDSTPDSGQVQIYGLSDITRSAVSAYWSATGRLLISILAGYEGLTLPLIRFADVRSTNFLAREGQDYVSTLTFDDGGDAIDLRLSATLLPNVTADQLVAVGIAALAKAPLIDPTLKPILIAQHPSVATTLASSPLAKVPFTLYKIGKVSDLFNEAARLCNARWFIRDGLLYFASNNIPTDPLIFAFPRTHWLGEASEDGKKTVQVPVVMDPLAVPGSIAVLVGRVAPAVPETYRIEAASYEMDTDLGLASMELTLKGIAV